MFLIVNTKIIEVVIQVKAITYVSGQVGATNAYQVLLMIYR